MVGSLGAANKLPESCRLPTCVSAHWAKSSDLNEVTPVTIDLPKGQCQAIDPWCFDGLQPHFYDDE